MQVIASEEVREMKNDCTCVRALPVESDPSRWAGEGNIGVDRVRLGVQSD
jgi:hypothetical protein